MIAAAVSLTSLQRRLDLLAVDQLRAECARLASENDDLREQSAIAREDADFWSREATEMHLQLCEQRGGSPGITIEGRLVVADGGAK